MAVRSANAYDSIYSELNQMPIRLETSLLKFGKMNIFFSVHGKVQINSHVLLVVKAAFGIAHITN